MSQIKGPQLQKSSDLTNHSPELEELTKICDLVPFHYAQAFSELAKVKILLEALTVIFSGTNKKIQISVELP